MTKRLRNSDPAWAVIADDLPSTSGRDGRPPALGYWPHTDTGRASAEAYAARCASHGRRVRVAVDPPRPTAVARLRCCDAAVLVLRESRNPAVGAGDSGLLHTIAERAGIAPNGWITEKRVLDALTRRPGELVPGWFRTSHGRTARQFVLPEESAKGYGVPT